LRLAFSSIASKFFYRAEAIARPPGFEQVLARLADATGVIFVVDSQEQLKDHNLASLRRLKSDLKLAGREPSDVRVVFQLNKRDLPNALPPEVLMTVLRQEGGWHEYVESVASIGAGTEKALELIMRLSRGPA
jgi:signal recognition particle receptor subunit beta